MIIVELDSTSSSWRDYNNILECQRKNLNCIASHTANTILYNLSFLPQELLDDPFTQEIVPVFSYIYPRYRFTTSSNFWEETSPERTLDISEDLLVASLARSILRYNGLNFSDPSTTYNDLPYFAYLKKGVSLDRLTGTIVYDDEYDYIYLEKLTVKIFDTSLLTAIEQYMQKRTGSMHIRYMEQGIKNNFDCRAVYEFKMATEDR